MKKTFRSFTPSMVLRLLLCSALPTSIYANAGEQEVTWEQSITPVAQEQVFWDKYGIKIFGTLCAVGIIGSVAYAGKKLWWDEHSAQSNRYEPLTPEEKTSIIEVPRKRTKTPELPPPLPYDSALTDSLNGRENCEKFFKEHKDVYKNNFQALFTILQQANKRNRFYEMLNAALDTHVIKKKEVKDYEYRLQKYNEEVSTLSTDIKESIARYNQQKNSNPESARSSAQLLFPGQVKGLIVNLKQFVELHQAKRNTYEILVPLLPAEEWEDALRKSLKEFIQEYLEA